MAQESLAVKALQKKPSAAAMRAAHALVTIAHEQKKFAFTIDAEFAPLIEAAERISNEVVFGSDCQPSLPPTRSSIIQLQRALAKIKAEE